VSTSPDRRASRARWLAIVASAVVVVTVASALITIGPPARQRRVALDSRRVQELASLTAAIERGAYLRGSLPAALADLDGAGQWLSITDPETAAPYGYAVTGDRTYRLCAAFATPTQSADAATAPAGGAWSHPAGRHCFDRRAKTR
jgi:hypothetical protein